MHDAELQMNQYMPKLAEFNKANDVSQRDSKVSGYKQNNYTVLMYVPMFHARRSRRSLFLANRPTSSASSKPSKISFSTDASSKVT
jgi:hypothetical protein